MNPKISRAILRSAVALTVGWLFLACGDVKVREYNAARWVEPDSVFVYLHHAFTIHGEGGGWKGPDRTTYPASRVRLMYRKDGLKGLGPARVLLDMEATVPCGQLVYRASDSMAYFSYLELTEDNGIARNGCGFRSDRRIRIGKLSGTSWEPREAPSEGTALWDSLLAELQASQTVAQGEFPLLIDSAFERLCVGAHCIVSPEF